MNCITCGAQSDKWAVLYVRLSEDDDGNEENVQDQIDKLSAMAHRDGFHILAIYNDNDKPASEPIKKPRPEFEKMLKAKGFSRIYIRTNDRLYRTPYDLGRIADTFSNKATIHREWEGHPLDLAQPGGMLIAGIMAQVAKYETDQKRLRQKTMNEVRARRGQMYKSGGVPFGWNDDYITLSKDAYLIRDAIKDVQKGKSLRSIAAVWNESTTTARGNEWTSTRVKEVLLRPTNAGIVIYQGKQINVDAEWEPIVSKAEYYDMKRFFMERSYVVDSTKKHVLSGTARCSECGGPLYAEEVQSKQRGKVYKYWYYSCKNTSKRHVAIRKEALEEYVTNEFLALGTFNVPSYTPISRGVDTAKIDARRNAIAQEMVKPNADHMALIAELQELDSRQAETEIIYGETVWEEIACDLILMVHSLDEVIQNLVIKPAGKRGVPMEQRVEVAFGVQSAMT